MKMANGIRRSRARSALLLSAFLSLLVPALALAQGEPGATKPAAPKWIYPAIPDFGGVHPREDAAVRPEPKEDYKIFVDVVSDHQDKSGNFVALNRLARIVNLMAYAKVPPEHVHIVALFDGKTAFASLTDSYYRKRFDMDNPNLAIIHALNKAGVEMLVCSQAMAGLGLPDEAIDPAVTISLSALTDSIVFGHRGYTYMQL